MPSTQRFQSSLSRAISRSAMVALAILFVIALVLIFTQPAQAQTFKVLYNFTGGDDGAYPWAGLTLDRAGNLYGTTYAAGGSQYGTVFRLTHHQGSWLFNRLHGFQGGDDGARPEARVIIAPDGSLYGTTGEGGQGCYPFGCGTIFNLTSPAEPCKSVLCPWAETMLYRFGGGVDGWGPAYGDLTFDQAGNFYGTTGSGGDFGVGAVYMLAPSNGSWTERVLYSFALGDDGGGPVSGVILDKVGNLYGITEGGGIFNGGTVFQLTPSGSGWSERVLYSFQGTPDGHWPFGGLVIDEVGNLYGTTIDGGPGGGGTVFELKPSNDKWTFTLLHTFLGKQGGPATSLTMDGTGALYGSTWQEGAYGYGNIFKLTPSGNGWIYKSLHDFTDGEDGVAPHGRILLDSNANLYGTTSDGGTGGDYCFGGCGLIWEITP